MEKDIIPRPDPSAVKEMISRARGIEELLRRIEGSESAQRTEAQSAARDLHDSRIRRALEDMDVEHINKGKLGIRTSLLRGAGITNVYQASGLSYEQICAIEGLGEQSALKIRDTVKQIVRNTEENTRMKIRADDPTPEDMRLIRALYAMIHTSPIREKAGELYRKNHKELQREIRLAKRALNGFAWMFRTKASKGQAAGAAECLRLRLDGGFGDPLLLNTAEKLEKVTPAECLADYRAGSPAYYTALEGLDVGFEHRDSALGGIPASLAERINALTLDLRYLKATLRGYQLFGAKYIVHQKKVLLGDEMGLGKTVQAIASMSAVAAEGGSHFMVVCPAGVLINWCREIERFCTLEVTKIHGNDEDALEKWRGSGGIAVTTYESISRFELPLEFKISMVVTDEAHYVKNPDAQRTKALLRLLERTERVLFMSGTPLENRVEEMCFLVSCLQPEIARELEGVKFISTAEQFRNQLAPVYLRRTREDVLQELPDLIEKQQWCDLGKKEAEAYKKAVLSENFMAIRQVSWHADDIKDSSKAARLLELCDQAREQGRKVIVFSFFRNTLKKVASLLGDRCTEPITGDISPARRQEIVDEFTKADSGAVLISQVQAGGTGLNIQSASVVIFCEPQLKPSIENQAISRAYRMGQVRDVLVYRLLADNTVDERIVEILKGKQLQFDSFADESVAGEESLSLKTTEESWITKLVEEEKKRLMENSPQATIPEQQTQ